VSAHCACAFVLIGADVMLEWSSRSPLRASAKNVDITGAAT
jgi:hypothetical protein